MELNLTIVMLIAFVLLIASVLASKVSRFGVPALLLFLAIGMLAGSEGPGGIAFDDPLTAQSMGIIALALILFAGGLDTQWQDVRPVWKAGVALATLGTLVTAESGWALRVQCAGHCSKGGAAPGRDRFIHRCGCGFQRSSFTQHPPARKVAVAPRVRVGQQRPDGGLSHGCHDHADSESRHVADRPVADVHPANGPRGRVRIWHGRRPPRSSEPTASRLSRALSGADAGTGALDLFCH
jgi:hypothetical protein